MISPYTWSSMEGGFSVDKKNCIITVRIVIGLAHKNSMLSTVIRLCLIIRAYARIGTASNQRLISIS